MRARKELPAECLLLELPKAVLQRALVPPDGRMGVGVPAGLKTLKGWQRYPEPGYLR